MTATMAYQLMGYFLAALSIVQSLEFLKLSKVTGDKGVWRWADISPVLAGTNLFWTAWFASFLSSSHFIWLNIFRIIVAITLFIMPNPISIILLLFLHILTLLRWLGGVNGGSDYMCMLLLLFVGIGWSLGGSMAIVCLWYIAFQACLSYFKAGWIKLKNPQWRNGFALKEFVTASIYEQKAWLTRLTSLKFIKVLGSWFVILFEITFPICLLRPELSYFYLTLGLCFHLLNAYVFGLNRFVWAWVAAYPALYYFVSS